MKRKCTDLNSADQDSLQRRIQDVLGPCLVIDLLAIVIGYTQPHILGNVVGTLKHKTRIRAIAYSDQALFVADVEQV